MHALHSEPQHTDFVPLSEYQSSTPRSFALEEAPVLWLAEDVDDERSCWVASNGVYIWSRNTNSGSLIAYNELSFVGSAHNEVLMQVNNGELLHLRSHKASDLYKALTACSEKASYHEGDNTEGFDADASLGPLESGDADDLGEETLDGPSASASVKFEQNQILGKRRRE